MNEQESRILIVDDEANARNALAEILSDEGYVTKTAADGFKALPSLEAFSPHLVLTDLKMPGMDGVQLLAKVRQHDPEIPVVVMTAFGEVETAVSAIRAGAVDYLTKPLNADQLLVVLRRALEHYRLRLETRQLRERLDQRYQFSNILGRSAEMQSVFKAVSQVAKSRATVLITGASGTGKELVAAAIHQNSTRQAGPFVKLHCAALVESLLESELFGHERGAFTGADRRREGRFEVANGGTLFLDEIAEISPSIQVKLLRVLQEREFERVGGSQTLKTDVRVIAATNRDLATLVEQGKFRQDLFYRLNVVNIRLPPLSQRMGDVAALADHFLRKFCEENGKEVSQISAQALARLARYHWPGNVRELENVMERAVVMCEGSEIGVEHFPPEMMVQEDGEPRIPGSSLTDIERYAILRTLEHCGGSTSKAAEILGISVRKIQYKLQEYGAAPKSEGPAVAN
jgi:two-component system response regulator HydG